MIVNWKEQRLKIVPTLAGESFILFPGYNDIPDRVIEEMRASLALDVKLGRIVFAERKVDGKNVAVPLERIPIAKIRAMCADTNNLASLKSWLKEEDRDDVRHTIQKRIDEIEAEMKRGGQNIKKDEEDIDLSDIRDDAEEEEDDSEPEADDDADDGAED